MGEHGSTNGNGSKVGRIWFRAREVLFLTRTGSAGPEQITMDCRSLRKSAGKDLQPSFSPPKWNHMNTEASETQQLPHPRPPHGTTWKLLDREIWELCPSSQCNWASNLVHTYYLYVLFSVIFSYVCICLLVDLVVRSLLSWAWGHCSRLSSGSPQGFVLFFFTTPFTASLISCTPLPIPTSFLFLSLSPPLFTFLL